MRVIGGTARGRRINAPRLKDLRPTSDRVREAIFDVLASLDAVVGAEVLDLFAGSGALGIEALSRGAASVTFVESDRDAVAAIEANLAHLGFPLRRAAAVGGALVRPGLRPPAASDLRPLPATGEKRGASRGASAALPPGPVATVVRAEAMAWCAAQPLRFDLALCDPPYRFEEWPALLERLPAGLAVLESSRPVQLSGGFASRRSYRYGTTVVAVVARGDAAPEAST